MGAGWQRWWAEENYRPANYWTAQGLAPAFGPGSKQSDHLAALDAALELAGEKLRLGSRGYAGQGKRLADHCKQVAHGLLAGALPYSQPPARGTVQMMLLYATAPWLRVVVSSEADRIAQTEWQVEIDQQVLRPTCVECGGQVWVTVPGQGIPVEVKMSPLHESYICLFAQIAVPCGHAQGPCKPYPGTMENFRKALPGLVAKYRPRHLSLVPPEPDVAPKPR